MGNEEIKLVLVNDDLEPEQIKSVLERTPKQYIYSRPGKGGKQFTYVPVGYVQKKLNRTFGFAGWDFEIVDQGIIENQIWVKGKLTVKDSKGRTITKMQFGASDVKRTKETKEMLSLGNDMKIATSDALKKCAALLGIASDVYYEKEYRELDLRAIKDLPTPESKKVAE